MNPVDQTASSASAITEITRSENEEEGQNHPPTSRRGYQFRPSEKVKCSFRAVPVAPLKDMSSRKEALQ